ncbi:SLOG family protein [Lysinibacillus sp. FSL K6-0057]|uniref:SLOG family protein n=1 Tax=Lysinibacillus sp. FSL K6-0057 TaxID=2921411 RepID=UPI00315AEB77
MVNTACFTGHRPNKLNGYNPKDNSELLFKLRDIIIDHIENKEVVTFISGMALGVDMWASRIVLKLKETYPHIRLLCAIPCDKQYSKWFESSIKEYHDICAKADEIYYVSKEPYNNYCMFNRDKWMVDRSDFVIGVYDGSKSGTGHTINYARKLEKEIITLHPKTLEIK